jgi:cysteine desulfurase
MIEHPAVLAAAKKKRHTFAEPSAQGVITAEAVRAAVTVDTELVSVQLANNEIGTIQPIREIAEIVRIERTRRADNGETTPIYFHCDASQGFGQVDVNIGRLGVDMLTLNSAKMYGPKQAGLLWVRPGVKLEPQIVGGGQERGLRSGTENVAGTIGFALAAEIASSKRHGETERLSKLRNDMEDRLRGHFDQLIISGHPKRRLAGSLHVSIPGLDGERIVFLLERKNVLLATGSACAANKGSRSHVLTAIGMDDQTADGSLRITLGRLSDEEGVEKATDYIIEAIEAELKRVGHA